jgi:transcriptional regulator with XRE-family HTH domain
MTNTKELGSAMSTTPSMATTVIPDSSQRLVSFLEETNLHKKDFAEMIGVTLSYVYSLIDNTVPFSTRTTTLERIAIVMGTEPETFPEYRRSEEPRLIDPGVEFLKSRQQALNLSNVHFIKRFPRNRRLEMVDMWRGALPLPLDWAYLISIGEILEIPKQELFPFWQSRFQQYLQAGGIEPMANMGLLNAIFEGVRKHLDV